jgi:hypothetical protein
VEDLGHAESGERGGQMIVPALRHAARGDDHVELREHPVEASLDLLRHITVVEPLHQRIARVDQCGPQREIIAASDKVGRDGGSDLDQFVAGGNQGDPRQRGDA